MRRQLLNYGNNKCRNHCAPIILLCLLLGFLFVFSFPKDIRADDDRLPPDLQAKLLLTVLAYDKNLPKKTTDTIGIGLMYLPSLQDSYQEAMDLEASLKKFKEKKINGFGFTVHPLAYVGEQSLRQALQDTPFSVVCIMYGVTKDIKIISRIFKDKKVFSCVSSIEAFRSGDLSLHIGIKGKKPKIYINLSSAVAEGTNFSAKFLRIAEVLDQ